MIVNAYVSHRCLLLQKHRGRASGSLDVANRSAMDRMMSTPLASEKRGITHRISKDRADFWKEDQNQPKDKKDNHKGLSCQVSDSIALHGAQSDSVVYRACFLLMLHASCTELHSASAMLQS